MVMEELWPRRQMLAGLGAAAAAALFPRSGHAADSLNKPRRIDVHHHVPPPAYNEFVASGRR